MALIGTSENVHNWFAGFQDPNEAPTDLLDYMTTSPAYKVGELKRRNSTQHTAGSTVTELSEHQRTPRPKIYQHSKG